MAFMRLVIPTLLLCAVMTTCLKPSSSQRTTTVTFDAIPKHINVLKNETVEFICEQNANNPFNIRFKGIVLVKNKQVVEEFSNIFDFHIFGLTTGNLTLKRATEEYKGTYRCGEVGNEKYAVIEDVYTLISSRPICKSSIEIGPYIFEDQIDLIEINCTSEDRVPHVTMSNHIILGNKTTNVTSISTKTTSSHPHPSKTLSFSSYFNSSFNNSVFVCNVSQQLPAPYQSYQGSCSFGPSIFLPLFSVTATPSNINFSDVRNVLFRCTSNVSEVRLSWSNIPNHWKYDNMGSDASIELNVSDTGRGVYSGDIQCIGYYGDRNITSTIQIRATNDPGTEVSYGDANITSMDYNEINEINDSGPDITVALVITAIIFCLILTIVIVVLYFRLNVSFCNRNPDLAKQNSSTNNANVRNTTITDDVVSSMRSQTDNSALDVPAMIDNTIYENIRKKIVKIKHFPKLRDLKRNKKSRWLKMKFMKATLSVAMDENSIRTVTVYI